jgi:hypothetical protein
MEPNGSNDESEAALDTYRVFSQLRDGTSLEAPQEKISKGKDFA